MRRRTALGVAVAALAIAALLIVLLDDPATDQGPEAMTFGTEERPRGEDCLLPDVDAPDAVRAPGDLEAVRENACRELEALTSLIPVRAVDGAVDDAVERAPGADDPSVPS